MEFADCACVNWCWIAPRHPIIVILIVNLIINFEVLCHISFCVRFNLWSARWFLPRLTCTYGAVGTMYKSTLYAGISKVLNVIPQNWLFAPSFVFYYFAKLPNQKFKSKQYALSIVNVPKSIKWEVRALALSQLKSSFS